MNSNDLDTTSLKINQLEEHILPDYKAYFKALGIKTWNSWHKDKQIDQ